MTSTETPRIYVACLASYNAGTLHGEWIDAAQDVDEINAEVQAMLAASPEPHAEEWAIHDFDGFHGIRLSEYEDFATVAKLAELLEEHDGAFAAFYENDPSGDLDDLGQRFEDAYQGEADSEQAYAEQYVDDTGMLAECPDNVSSYFDYEKFARDLFMDGMWSAPTGAPSYGVYVFASY